MKDEISELIDSFCPPLSERIGEYLPLLSGLNSVMARMGADSKGFLSRMRRYTISSWPPACGAVSGILGSILLQGTAHEPRSDRLCSTGRTAPETRLRECRRTLRGAASGAPLLVHGPTAVHDLRANHGPGQPARDRLLPPGHRTAALSLRDSRAGGAQHDWPTPTSSAIIAFSWTPRW